jgi:hypothetical protein
MTTDLKRGIFPELHYELLLMAADQVETILRFPPSMLIPIIHTVLVVPMPYL